MEQQAALLGHREWLHPKAGAGHQVHGGQLPHAGDDPTVLEEAGEVHSKEAGGCY